MKRSPDLEHQKKSADLVVVMPVKDWNCAECGGASDLLTMDDRGPLCMTCADLDHLVFLGAGDAALTRRAKKASVLSAVVVRWSRSRRRYERQGILVEEAALEQAEQECLADEDARLRRRERAVVASVRHDDTNYDSLLMSGVPRDVARDRIRPDIDRILAAWA